MNNHCCATCHFPLTATSESSSNTINHACELCGTSLVVDAGDWELRNICVDRIRGLLSNPAKGISLEYNGHYAINKPIYQCQQCNTYTTKTDCQCGMLLTESDRVCRDKTHVSRQTPTIICPHCHVPCDVQYVQYPIPTICSRCGYNAEKEKPMNTNDHCCDGGGCCGVLRHVEPYPTQQPYSPTVTSTGETTIPRWKGYEPPYQSGDGPSLYPTGDQPTIKRILTKTERLDSVLDTIEPSRPLTFTYTQGDAQRSFTLDCLEWSTYRGDKATMSYNKVYRSPINLGNEAITTLVNVSRSGLLIATLVNADAERFLRLMLG